MGQFLRTGHVNGFLTPEGEIVSPVEYLRRCREDRSGYMDPIVVAGILKTIQHRGRGVTASMLVGCPLKGAQSILVDHAVDPQSLIYFAFRGTMIHTIAETIATKQSEFPGALGVEIERAIKETAAEYLIEKRFFRRVRYKGLDLDMSGQIDRYHFPTKALLDYKSIDTFAIIKVKDEGAKAEHEAQTNFQRWLMEGPDYGMTVARIEIGYVGMAGVIRTGRLNSIRTIERGALFPVRPVELWAPGRVEEELLPKAYQIKLAYLSEGRDLPDPDPGENAWRCGFCPFNGSIRGNWECARGKAEMERKGLVDLLVDLRRRIVAEKIPVDGKVPRFPFADVTRKYKTESIGALTLDQVKVEIEIAEGAIRAVKAKAA